MNVFVTGGTGYIGSHTVVELIDAMMRDTWRWQSMNPRGDEAS